MIAVTGITGHTGAYFLQELIKHHFSDTIRCLVRATSDTQQLDKSGLKFEKIVGSLEDQMTIDELVNGVSAIVHITNIRYSLEIVKAANHAGVPRIVLVHTTGIYSKYKIASDEYKHIEGQLAQYLNSDMDITIIRPTMIFGDLCDHNIHKFIKMVDKLPIMPEINHGTCLLQPVNARDLGRVYYHVLCCSNLPERFYDVSGERAVSMHELFDLIGEYLGKRVSHLSVPLGLGTFFAHCLKIISFGKVNYIERILRMGENRNYEHVKATQDFNYKPEPFNVGLKREVQAYIAVNKVH